jgi:hypothetical protein
MDKRTCSETGCNSPVLARGLCIKDYRRFQVAGKPMPPTRGEVRRKSKCAVEDCPRPQIARTWCPKHYGHWLEHGDPVEAPPRRLWRRYGLDDSFFDVIDTEAKAYWLGFINADGCVRAGPVGAAGWQRHALSVKLKESDAGHLRKLKADMASESPIYIAPQAGRAGPAAGIDMSSPHLVESLISLGVTPRKSLTATPWDGPAHLMRHYWRGMVDGDGTIGKHPGPRDKWYLKLIGSEAVVEAFRVWAVAVTGSVAEKCPKGNIWSWTAGGLASPQALARELYGGSTVYLDRKHALALQLMAAPIRHRSWLVKPTA